MRLIEFRCWNGISMYEFWIGDYVYLTDKPIMQFTGLLDKNGKKIFEGDIVKWLSLKFPITVDDFHGYTFMYGEGRLFRAVAEDGEVIGNIYENGDLLT